MSVVPNTQELKRLRHLVWFLIGMFGMIVVVLLVGGVVLIAGRQTTNASATQGKLDASQKTLDLAVDCLEPGGDCYERNLEMQAEYLSQTAQTGAATASYAEACAAKGVTKPDAMYACVVKAFNERMDPDLPDPIEPKP